MKKRMTILYLVFSMLFVLTGCGKWWNDLRRPNPRNQSPSMMQINDDFTSTTAQHRLETFLQNLNPFSL